MRYSDISYPDPLYSISLLLKCHQPLNEFDSQWIMNPRLKSTLRDIPIEFGATNKMAASILVQPVYVCSESQLWLWNLNPEKPGGQSESSWIDFRAHYWVKPKECKTITKPRFIPRLHLDCQFPDSVGETRAGKLLPDRASELFWHNFSQYSLLPSFLPWVWWFWNPGYANKKKICSKSFGNWRRNGSPILSWRQ